ncbi:GntR family transcriptional regulator [Gluconacetobacter takamatsuzukensis]|uniref:GntR family transcriptional regulator n=1 Tax=Gluconacetobacter takamatsuzukensis TaxID=1286190 RepID=UPI001C80EF3D
MAVLGKAKTPLVPIRTLESSEFASEQIRNAIISGEFQPGDRLVEQQLTEMLDVSRHPIREALRVLAREGFVELRRNRGAIVSAVDAADVLEVYKIRMALGKIALTYLIEELGGMDARNLRVLEKLSQNATRFAQMEKQEETIQNDLKFQQAIIDATGLQRTIRCFSELTGDVRRFNCLLGAVYTDRSTDAERYVVALYHAIRDRDLAAAQRIWQAKFDKAVERYLALIKDVGSDGIATDAKR